MRMKAEKQIYNDKNPMPDRLKNFIQGKGGKLPK
jgi:hypothetical protein